MATRTKKTSVNFIIGIISQFISIFIPFLIRSLVINKLGAEYLGLSSVVMSILNVLNLTELGFSNAIVFSLYKPLANDDKQKISALLNYYKKIYKIIGFVILIVGLLLTPFLSSFINKDIPNDINIYAVFLIYLSNTVVSYFLFSYKRAILVADQNKYIVSLTNSLLLIMQSIAQVIILLVFNNFYLFILLLPIFTIINNLMIAFISQKKYKLYFSKEELDVDTKNDLKTRIAGLFIFKIAGATRTSFDSVFISMYLGLIFVAMYSNYYYIMAGVFTMLGVVNASMIASVGNKTATMSLEDNYKDFKKFDFMQMLVTSWCSVMLLVLYQPFMEIWVGVDLLLPFSTMILFVIYFYCKNMCTMRAMYNDVNGLWWEQRYRTMIEATINIFLNWILVYFFGLFGIVLATIVTILIFGFGLSGVITFKHYFGIDKLKTYYVSHLKYILVTIVVCLVTYLLCNYISLENIYIEFIVKGIVASLSSIILFILLYFRDKQFKENLKFVKRLLKK